MAAGTFTLFNSFGQKLGKKLIDLEAGTFHLSLHTSGFTPAVASMADYADLTNELATAGGYTAGGIAVTPSWSRSGNISTFSYASFGLTATATLTFKSGVLFADNGGGVKPLIGYFNFDSAGADVTLLSGSVLTIAPPSGGLFSLTA